MNNTKPGYQTTEFWITTVVTVLTVLMASGIIPAGSDYSKIITEVLMVAGALGYHSLRTVTKAMAGGPDVPADVSAPEPTAVPGLTNEKAEK